MKTWTQLDAENRGLRRHVGRLEWGILAGAAVGVVYGLFAATVRSWF